MTTTSNDLRPSGEESDDWSLHCVRDLQELPDGVTLEDLTDFLHEALHPFGDPEEDITRGITDALSDTPAGRGFVLIAGDDPILGALVMLRTGMKGYVPENLLLYVAVDPEHRGQGIGGRLCEEALRRADGDVKLHVEYDNPAKNLYERLGFVNKYADMRWSG